MLHSDLVGGIDASMHRNYLTGGGSLESKFLAFCSERSKYSDTTNSRSVCKFSYCPALVPKNTKRYHVFHGVSLHIRIDLDAIMSIPHEMSKR